MKYDPWGGQNGLPLRARKGLPGSDARSGGLGPMPPGKTRVKKRSKKEERRESRQKKKGRKKGKEREDLGRRDRGEEYLLRVQAQACIDHVNFCTVSSCLCVSQNRNYLAYPCLLERGQVDPRLHSRCTCSTYGQHCLFNKMSKHNTPHIFYIIHGKLIVWEFLAENPKSKTVLRRGSEHAVSRRTVMTLRGSPFWPPQGSYFVLSYGMRRNYFICDSKRVRSSKKRGTKFLKWCPAGGGTRTPPNGIRTPPSYPPFRRSLSPKFDFGEQY